MENCTAGQSRLLPEQVWDAADIPALWNCFAASPPAPPARWCGLTPNTSSCAAPLRDGKIFDQPPQTVQRYLVEKPVAANLRLEVQQQDPLRPAQQEAAHRAAHSRAGALEHRRLENLARHQHPRHRSGHLHCSTCRPRRFPAERRSSSLSIGRRKIAGKVRTTSSCGVSFEK